jgi:thymidylate kinase
MDEQDLAFHRRVREGYLTMASQNAAQWLVVDAMQSIGEIQRIVRNRIDAES